MVFTLGMEIVLSINFNFTYLNGLNNHPVVETCSHVILY